MKNVVLYLCSLFLLASCGSMQTKMDSDKVKSIKTAAVVIYSVPESIEYKSDPRDPNKGLLAKLVAAATKKNGAKAAKVSYTTFVEQLNQEELPFQVLDAKAVTTSPKLAELYSPPRQEAGKKGMLSKMTGLLGGKKVKAVSPPRLNQYGLSKWTKGSALTGAKGEKEYIKKAIEALNVDAAIVVNDPGFSFSCEACVGSTGAASTGSGFNVSIVTRDGTTALDLQEYFLTTDAQAAMATGVVNPLQQESLFKEHGKKMAKVFADVLKDKLANKE